MSLHGGEGWLDQGTEYIQATLGGSKVVATYFQVGVAYQFCAQR